jgi:hypothetical protein
MAAIVVDGGGIGGGVIDRLCQLGVTRGLFEFNGGMPANDSNLLQQTCRGLGIDACNTDSARSSRFSWNAKRT